MKHLPFLALLLPLLYCTSARHRSGAAASNKFGDAAIRQIYTLQDERKTEALLPWLQHEKAVYREEAAGALASVQDKKAIAALSSLLQDPQPGVRRAAAYALGQTFDAEAEAPLLKAAGAEREPTVKAEVLEALGKCGGQRGLDYLAVLTVTDEKEKTGQAWGIYRSNNKGLDYLLATLKTVELLDQAHAPGARLGAAHFLARTPKLKLAAFSDALTQSAQSDPSPEVRMAVAQALAKVKTGGATTALLHLVQKDGDYRVRINAIKALSQSPFGQVKETVYQALHDRQVHAALAAADLLLSVAPPGEADNLYGQARQAGNWRVRATLLAAALKGSTDKGRVRAYIERLYQESGNLYEKGALLSALSQDVQAYSFIESQAFSGSPVLGTYGLQALADMRSRVGFPAALSTHFADLFRRAINSGDVALVGLAAGVLQQPGLQFKAAYPDLTFLTAARDRLQLPRDMETYQELDKTIRFLEGLPPAANPQNPFTHPINWALVQRLQPRQQVRLKTEKGIITLELLVEAAPGAVANFVELLEAGFFQGKNFHRVVPNFVVQGGDPRGDGWGGPDYSIRTELANLRYGEGYVGMASAGKDTEGCQWFITHSPTPHLDGRYAIFARVTGGMAVVHQLAVGDQLKSVSLEK